MSGRGYGALGEPKVHDGPSVRVGSLPTSVWSILGVILLAVLITMGVAIGALVVAANNNSGDGGALSTALSSLSSMTDYLASIAERSDTQDADTLIIGGGPGGLVLAYRTCKSLRSGLLVVDDRDYWGGKVFSYKSPVSSNSNPIYTPTHAEQFRGGDAILRCIAQELGKPCQTRPGPISHLDVTQRSTNATTVECYLPTDTITASPSCDAGAAADRYGPNGDLPIYPNAPSFCGESGWQDCSEINEYFNVLLDPANIATITPGEPFFDYAIRLFGESGAQFFREQSGYSYPFDDPADALQYVNYILYDFDYDYATLPVPVGGPQQVLLSMVARIKANATRMQLNTKIVSVDKIKKTSGGYRYLATTSTGDRIRAKRVVFAIPPGALKSMSGDIVEKLKQSKYVRTLGYNRACSWNAFFPTAWWQRLHTSCNAGYCTGMFSGGRFDLDNNTVARNYATWSLSQDHDIPFAQFVGTDERQRGKLLRIFIEGSDCEPLSQQLEIGGQGAIKNDMMKRLRRALPLDTIPNPTGYIFRDEEFSYSLPGIGTDYDGQELFDWAAEPLDREAICMSSEGYNIYDSGWQEGAAVSAHNCLRGPVFSELFHPSDIATKFERCTNVFTGRTLDKADPQFDQCLLLANEASLKDLAGLDFCGGPSTQTITAEDNDTISVSSVDGDWSGAAEDPIPADEAPRRSHRYAIV